MPGPVSQSYEGPSDERPKIPDWALSVETMAQRWLAEMPEKPRFTLTRKQLSGLLDEIQKFRCQVKVVEAVSEASDREWSNKLTNANQRIDNAVGELDRLADLLADSENLPIKQTHTVEKLDEIIDGLTLARR